MYKLLFIGNFILNHLLKKGDGSMDYSHIEKRLFGYILLIASLVALIMMFISSLLTLSKLYFIGLGFSEIELALINIGFVLSLIGIIALVINIKIKGLFEKRKPIAQIDAIPSVITNCVTEFIKGFNEK